MTRPLIQALLALAVLTWGAWFLLAGQALATEMLAPFSMTVAIQAAAVAFFEHAGWKWPLLRLLSPRPRLAGTWKMLGESSFNGDGNGGVTTFEGYYVIRQTFSTVSVRFISANTMSKTRSCQLVADTDGEWSLYGTYLDTPGLGDAPPHLGAFSLVLSGDPVSAFNGNYWTARGTRGKLKSIGASSKVEAVSFAAAQEAFSGSPTKA
jgi:hypothetical protein